MKKKFLVIVNPYSGRQKGRKIFQTVYPLFQKAGIRINMVETEYKAHARTLIREADLSSVDAVLGIGGDGTFHNMVNGLWQREDQHKLPLGLIPGGTANALCINLGCSSPTKIVDKIIAGDSRKIDLLEVKFPEETRYAFAIVHCGEAVDTVLLSEKIRWLGRPIRYQLCALINLLFFSREVELEIGLEDHKFKQKISNLMINKAKYVTKNMCMAPLASLNDGYLDLMLIRELSRWEKLKLFSGLLVGNFSDSPHVQYYKVKSVSFSATKKEKLNIDGEYCGGETPVSIRVLPSALDILA